MEVEFEKVVRKYKEIEVFYKKVCNENDRFIKELVDVKVKLVKLEVLYKEKVNIFVELEVIVVRVFEL